MRIEHLDLIRYGHFVGQAIPFPRADVDLHLIVGQNEAGKSTTRKAIADWLYGIPARSDMNIGYELSLLRIGGILGRGEADSLPFVRRKGNKDTLRSESDEVIAPEKLGPFLLGAPDREFFERMFCLDHEALRLGGQRMLEADGNDRVAQALFQSAAGITGLDTLLARLDEEAGELWGPQAKKARAYDQALAQYKEAKQSVDGTEVRFRRFRELEEAVTSAREAHSKAKADLESRRRRLAQIARVRRLVTPVALLRDAEARLAQLGTVRVLPDDAYKSASDAIKFIDAEIIKSRGFQGRIEQAQMGLAMFETNDEVWMVAEQVDDLAAKKVHVLQAVRDLPAVQAQHQAKSAKVFAGAKELGWGDVDAAAAAARIPSKSVRVAAEGLIEEIAASTADERRLQQQSIEVQAEFEQAQRALDAAGPEQDVGMLKIAKDDLAKQLQKRKTAEISEARKKLSAAMAGLEPWKGTVAELRSLQPPTEEEAQTLMSALGQHLASSSQSEQAIQRVAAGLAKCLKDEEPLKVDASGISVADLDMARERRDSIWSRLRSGESIESAAPSFEASVSEADRVADRRFDKAREAHEIDAIRKLRAQLEDENRSAQQKKQDSDAALAELRASWKARTVSLGLGELKPEGVPMWRERRDSALRLALDVDRLVEEQGEVDAAIQSACAAVRALKTDVPAELTAEMILRTVTDAVEASARTAGARATQAEALEKARTKKDRAFRLHEDAKARHEKLCERWAASSKELTLEGRTPELGRQLLKLMADMVTWDLEAKELRDRVEPMEQTIREFEAEVARLAQKTHISVEGQPLEARVRTLSGVVAAERESRRSIKTHREEIAKETKSKDASEALIQTRRGELKELLDLAGVAEPNDLLAAAQASEAYTSLSADVKRLREQVITHGEGSTIEATHEEVAREDIAALPVEASTLEEEITQFTHAVTEAFARLESANKAFNEVGGSSKAAEAEADRQMALSEMQVAVDRYVRVRSGAVILKWALKKYREQAQGPMLERAGQLFALLTEGGFSKLDVDYDSDKPALLGIRQNGASAVGIGGMSEGTRDALFLSLRLAAIELHLRERPPAVIVADDLFINLDDARAKAGFRALAEVAKRSQVIYLTHHDHLVPLAESVSNGVNTIRLTKP